MAELQIRLDSNYQTQGLRVRWFVDNWTLGKKGGEFGTSSNSFWNILQMRLEAAGSLEYPFKCVDIRTFFLFRLKSELVSKI